MTTWTRAWLAGISCVLAVGCADGAVGEQGRVRFSQVVNFAETSDFTAPLVVGRTVLIKLERPGAGRETYTELSLEVTGGAAQVLPMGFAQYAVRLDEETTYRLRAKEGTRELDALTASAKRGAAIRLSSQARVTTFGSSQGRSCTRGREVDVADLRLAPNQEAQVTVVPVDGAGAAMLGMLQLSAKASRGDIQLDTPLFLEGGRPNTLVIRPTLPSAPLGDATVEVQEPAFASLTVPVRMLRDNASITCD